MNGFDLAILAAAGLAALGGFRLGFIRRSVGWLGTALGLTVAFVILPSILEQFAGEERPRLVLVAAAVLFAGALLGQAAGLLVAASLRINLPSPIRGVDRVAGAVLGAVIVLLAVWLLLPIMKSIPTWPSEQADSSAIAGVIDDTLPDAPDALGGLAGVIDELALPTVFSDPSEIPEVTAPPVASPLAPALEATVAASAVRVSGVACNYIQQGSGFVLEPGLVVTNAHVVAGHESTEVEIPGVGRYAGRIVLFDPLVDLALVEVPELPAPPLALVGAEPGGQGIIAGYPGGGPLELSPYEVAQHVTARGTDIYSDAAVERDVLVLAAVLAPGDSGSPVVDQSGAVVGMAFAVAPESAEVAYALSDAELEEALARPRGSVAIGPCLAPG